MKRVVWLLMGLVSLSLMIGAVTVFQSCSSDLGLDTVIYYSSSASSTPPGGGSVPTNILRIYSDRADGTNLDMASAWEIWESSVTLNPVIDGNDGGNNATECVKASKTWLGFAMKTTNSPDISGYNFLVLSLKISSDFSQDLQVGEGWTNASWYDLAETRDGAWHIYVVDITTNTNHPDVAFALKTSGGSWGTGTVRFDDVYLTKTTNHLSNYSAGYPVSNVADNAFGIFSETTALDIDWASDVALDVWHDWSANTAVTETNVAGNEGTKCWTFQGTGAWIGIGVRVNPISSTRNLSAYTNGYLHLMLRGIKTCRLGVKSNDGTPQEAWMEAADLASYGYALDDAWHTLLIPISAFKTKNASLNMAAMEQYFMFVEDTLAGGHGLNYTLGDTFYVDDLYYTNN